MKLTNVLHAQHLGWNFKRLWNIKGKRIPIDTGAEAVLTQLKLPVVSANELIQSDYLNKSTKLKVDLDYFDSQVKSEVIEETNKCYVYQDKHVLLEGITQAKILTNTIGIVHIPKRIEDLIKSLSVPSKVNKNVQNAILSSFVYDSEQEKLDIIKDPNRPAYRFPRVYGISDDKKSQLTISKLLFECEKLAGSIITGKRKIINSDVNFITTFEKYGEKIQLNIPVQMFMTSNRPIEPFTEKYKADLPDLYPLKCTVSIPKEVEIPTNNFYPLEKDLNISHPHTVIIYYSTMKNKNLHETPVTNTQFEARTLMAAFSAAAARAQQLYGNNIKHLPKPIVVQSIQTTGKKFHFGIYQLNSLDLDNIDIKNYWFDLSNMELFEECCYLNGRPILKGYNKNVIEYVRAIYQNQ